MKIIRKSLLFVIFCLCMVFGFACMSAEPIQPTVTLKTISLENYKTEFVYGQDFTVGDLVVTAKYSDGTEKVVTNYTVNSTQYDKETAGKYPISIQYKEGGKSCAKTYNVKVCKSYEVDGLKVEGARTEFAYGEEFSFAGAVQQKFTDGALMNVENYSVDSSAYDKDVAGKYEIIVTAGDLQTKYTVKVMPSTIVKAFTVNESTTKFTIGDPFTFDGNVTVEYEDGRVEENSDNYQVDSSSYQAYQIGSYAVKVLVGDGEYTYNVAVEKATTLKVLMIGNSYADDTRYYVPWMAEALDFEEVIIGSLYIGGCSVKTHYLNTVDNLAAYDFRCYENNRWNDFVGGEGTKQTMEYAIKYQDWDYITIQQASVDSGKADTYNSDLDNLVSYVKKTATKKDVRLVWNMTWAYREGYSVLSEYNQSQLYMYNSIASAVQERIETNPAFEVVLPAGTAVQNARTSYIGDDFNMEDGTHLNFYRGRYIAGLTLFCSLTGYTPDEVSYAPSSMTRGEILVAKESVKNALACKYAVTNSQYVEAIV